MFRRRPRRPFGPFRPRPRGAVGRPRLARAERLFAAGNFAEAAEAFDDLSRQAEERGMLDPAGDLALRAARCYLHLDDLDKADERAERAIRLFIKARKPRKVRRLLPKVLDALEQHGRQADADALRREVEEAFQGLLEGRPQGPLAARMAARLPAQCPNCGAPIKPREVSWVGPATAECPYCGGTIKPE